MIAEFTFKLAEPSDKLFRRMLRVQGTHITPHCKDTGLAQITAFNPRSRLYEVITG